ncbi:MAG: hypothetical protein ABJF01_12235 [bacterium]
MHRDTGPVTEFSKGVGHTPDVRPAEPEHLENCSNGNESRRVLPERRRIPLSPTEQLRLLCLER